MKIEPPKHFHFNGLAADEEIRLFLRRHVIVFWRHVGLFIFFGFVPIIIWIALATQTDWIDDTSSLAYVVFVFCLSLFYLFWIRGLFTMWIDYYLDVWVVTTKRIMRIEHEGMFNRKISEQRLSKIQDVTTEVKGFWQTMLKFGDIHVQTAAETEFFIFKDIERPEAVAKEISLLQEQEAHPSRVEPVSTSEVSPEEISDL